MHEGTAIGLIVALCSIRVAQGLQCLKCVNALSRADCIAKGTMETCAPDQQMSCETEIRYGSGQTLITKGCKQTAACANEQTVDDDTCKENGVCRCCCGGDDCNRANFFCSADDRCDVLNTPVNGGKDCQFEEYEGENGTTCTFSCDQGFDLVGVEVSVCQVGDEGAAFTSLSPVCSEGQAGNRPNAPEQLCDRLQAPMDGNMICDFSRIEGELGTTCVFSCNPGFQMIGMENSVCAATDQGLAFSITAPECQPEPNSCQPNPCLNGGRCSRVDDEDGRYYCECGAGFSGFNCENEITDECRPNPCSNGGSCTRLGGGEYACDCDTGFSGADCRIDACASNQCLNGGSCVRALNDRGYVCQCAQGYRGDDCQEEIPDPCRPNPCENGGQCTRLGGGGFHCNCAAGFLGADCGVDACERNSCLNGGECVPAMNGRGYTCMCEEGYSGEDCELEIQCDLLDAPENGAKSCTFETFEGEIGTTCTFTCNAGYRPVGLTISVCRRIGQGAAFTVLVPRCISISQPITQRPATRATATPARDSSRLRGTCEDSPVATGGGTSSCIRSSGNVFCTYSCGENADLVGAKVLVCSPRTGWIGATPLCVPKGTPDPCRRNPCQNGGYCTRTTGGYACSCANGFSGANCQTDACRPNRCLNGGACFRVENERGYACRCAANFRGENCGEEIPDPCARNPCGRGGSCTRTNGYGHFCSCFAGYSGLNCENDACNPSRCLNGATCRRATYDVDARGYVCICRQGFRGARCGVSDPCQANPCQNGGICRANNGGYVCACAAGFSGVNCDNDACLPNPCRNGGTCSRVRGGSRYSCRCRVGFRGKNCEQEIQCNLLDAPENGVKRCRFESSEGEIGSTCTFLCDAGYRAVGITVSVCRRIGQDAQFSALAPTCVKIPERTTRRPAARTPVAPSRLRTACDNAPEPPKDGLRSCFQARGTVVCIYFCGENEYLLGKNVLTCNSRTGWDGTSPQCIPSSGQCNMPQILTNGNVVCDGNGEVGTRCNYQCNSGYELVGQSRRECVMQNGRASWSCNDPSCQLRIDLQ